MSGEFIKISQRDGLNITNEDINNAVKGLENGISKGKSDFSGPISNRFFTTMNMLECGVHKDDTYTCALGLSFKRYLASARIVSTQFSPFISLIRKVLKSGPPNDIVTEDADTDEETDEEREARIGDYHLDALNGYFSGGFGSVPSEPNKSENKTMIDAYSIEGSDRDKLGFFNSRVIPIFASKWKAVTNLGGSVSTELFVAVVDWANFVDAMSAMSSTSIVRPEAPGADRQSSGGRPGGGGAPAPAPTPTPDPVDVAALIRFVTIDSVTPVSPAGITLSGEDLVINRSALSAGNDLIIRLEIVGGDSAAINSASSSDIFMALASPPRSLIMIPDDVRNALRSSGIGLLDIFSPRTTMSRSNTIIMDIVILGGVAPRLWGGVAAGDFRLMRVIRPVGAVSVSAGDTVLLNRLIKLSDGGQTTPLYETVSPSGKSVSFTPAQLVAGGGKIKGKDGKSFKVKKWKGRSLADRVMSKEFGKVKTKSKKKRK